MGRDPLAAKRGAANIGSAALDRGSDRSRELAEVVAYNSSTHTALVRTHTGRPLPNVPQIRPGPNDYEHLKVGTTVVVSYDLGFPVIDGVLTIPGPPQDVLSAPTITGVDGVGDDNPLQPTDGANNYRPPTAPSDMTQGDWAKVGALGNHVAVLEGGISSLGSPNALIRSLGLIGLLQTIAKSTQTVTDFGEWKVTNDQGRTSFTLRAGANQTTQTGLDEGHWTIRIDLGAAGDLFDFQITDPVGKTLFKLHVGADGRVQLYGDAGVDISSGPNGDNEQNSDIIGSRTTNIGADDALTVDGNRTMTVGKAVTENIATDKQTAVGNDDSLFVNKDRTVSVGGNQTRVVAGGAAKDAKPGNTAYAVKVLNGGYMIDIGNPADGANISAMAGFALKTALGDISVESGGGMTLKAKQQVDIDGLVVNVGGNTHPMPLWDTFLRELGQFLTTLLIGLQVGTVGSPFKQQLVGINSAAAQLQQFIQKVAMGVPYESKKANNG